MRKYSEGEIKKIVESVLGSCELSELMHIPASTIRRIRREKGQDRSKKGKIFSPDINEFMEMYDHYNGIISRVAEYYGVDRHKVAEYARGIGIKTDRKLGITDAEKDKIVSMYNSMSAKKVAEIYGVSESYISALWSRRGLTGKEIRVYKIDQSVFDEIDSELKAYFLGFFAADGCLYKPSSHGIKNKQDILRISIHRKDEEILREFNKLFKTDKPLSYHKDYVSFEISSNMLASKIEALGIGERKTYGNTICNLPYRLMRHFIRGYFDGDGTVGKNLKSVSIAGYKRNLYKIAEELGKRNIYAKIINDKRNCKGQDDFGSLTFSNLTGVYCFLKYIYCDSTYYLKRKKEMADEIINKIESSNKTRDLERVNYCDYAVLGIKDIYSI